MKRLFYLFLKEKQIDLQMHLFKVRQLAIDFNAFQYSKNEVTNVRRFASNQRVNKHIMRHWVAKHLDIPVSSIA